MTEEKSDSEDHGHAQHRGNTVRAETMKERADSKEEHGAGVRALRRVRGAVVRASRGTRAGR